MNVVFAIDLEVQLAKYETIAKETQDQFFFFVVQNLGSLERLYTYSIKIYTAKINEGNKYIFSQQHNIFYLIFKWNQAYENKGT